MKTSTTGSTGRAVSNSPPERISEVLLLDGSTASLRRLGPGDVDAIMRLSETLTDEDRYYRFFTLHPAYLQTWARSLTDLSSDQYAIGAFESGKLIGVANYVPCDPAGTAEVSVLVAHNEHLRGVGTAMLRQLGLTARRNGLHHFVADVLAENHLMSQVMADAGWPCTRHLDGSVLNVDVDLDKIDDPTPKVRA
jgi:RimJ/RimL family protein N-acetyltransferase